MQTKLTDNELKAYKMIDEALVILRRTKRFKELAKGDGHVKYTMEMKVPHKNRITTIVIEERKIDQNG